jgi:hypothetical protein
LVLGLDHPQHEPVVDTNPRMDFVSKTKEKKY